VGAAFLTVRFAARRIISAERSFSDIFALAALPTFAVKGLALFVAEIFPALPSRQSVFLP
jgi:hypothetical protein